MTEQPVAQLVESRRDGAVVDELRPPVADERDGSAGTHHAFDRGANVAGSNQCAACAATHKAALASSGSGSPRVRSASTRSCDGACASCAALASVAITSAKRRVASDTGPSRSRRPTRDRDPHRIRERVDERVGYVGRCAVYARDAEK